MTTPDGEVVEQREHSSIIGGSEKLSQSLWKSLCSFLGKMRIDLPLDPTIPLFDINPNNALSYHRDTCWNNFFAVLFIQPRN